MRTLTREEQVRSRWMEHAVGCYGCRFDICLLGKQLARQWRAARRAERTPS
ncbi:hypothetical protein [Streptomyces fumanus]|uniref:hypothetical protein n=1 Tax=Streptomyces fumanus TaxID=67302 RepID=UPI0033D73651